MKVGNAFPSKWLKAEEFPDNWKATLTIAKVTMEEVGKDDTKPVLWFKDKTKGFVLNQTNANTIADITGQDEMDDWRGARVLMYRTKVDYQGKRVPALRFEAVPDGQPKREELPPPAPFEAGDEDVPF